MRRESKLGIRVSRLVIHDRSRIIRRYSVEVICKETCSTKYLWPMNYGLCFLAKGLDARKKQTEEKFREVLTFRDRMHGRAWTDRAYVYLFVCVFNRWKYNERDKHVACSAFDFFFPSVRELRINRISEIKNLYPILTRLEDKIIRVGSHLYSLSPCSVLYSLLPWFITRPSISTLRTSTKNLSDFIGRCNQIRSVSKVYLLAPNR